MSRLQRCPACSGRFPSSWFEKTRRSVEGLEWCERCRSDRTQEPLEKPSRLVVRATLADRLARFRGRRELERFRERGSPVVERPYVRLPNGHVAPKKTSRARAT